MSKIVLFGTGRGADVAYRFLSGDTDHEIVAFAVDDAHRHTDTQRGLPVVAFEEVETIYPPDDFRMLVLLGYQDMNGLRQRKYDAAKDKGYILESYIASDIFRVEPLNVGENCFILDNQSISLDVRIGNNVVMWSSNHVGDLTTISDHAWVASHATLAANVEIGEHAFLGIGCTVSNAVKVGANSLIGADALVVTDTTEDSVHLNGKGAIDIGARDFMRMMMARNKL